MQNYFGFQLIFFGKKSPAFLLRLNCSGCTVTTCKDCNRSNMLQQCHKNLPVSEQTNGVLHNFDPCEMQSTCSHLLNITYLGLIAKICRF